MQEIKAKIFSKGVGLSQQVGKRKVEKAMRALSKQSAWVEKNASLRRKSSPTAGSKIAQSGELIGDPASRPQKKKN